MILVIGEKPSVSKELAKVLGADKNNKTHIDGNGYIVSWCFGHLVGLKSPNDYGNGWENKWSFSQLPIIPEKWLFKITDSTKAQFYVLKDLMNNPQVKEIICATDADREGECIFRYVYNMAKCIKPVKRLWVSSLEESAIKSALAKMKPLSDYDNLYSAGYARARADWLVGMNGSRLFSCRYENRLILGRVQTPTLAMIVKRDNEVKNFVKQKYYTCDLDCGGFTLSSARIDDELQADNLISACNNSIVTVIDVKKEVKSNNAPKLYDLTTLQREANKAYGYTAQQTLEYVQSLYEGKLVTYPRIDSQYLSDDMKQTALDMVDVINTVFDFNISHEPNIDKCINNSKVTGHHAIIPTSNIGETDLNSLSTGEKNVLTLIATRLMCASAPAYKYEAVKITANCSDTEFTATGKTVIDKGWKKYAIKSEDEEDVKALPELSVGQRLGCSASKGEHYTSPPKPYTEDTLLSAMEHAGLEDFDAEAEKKGLGTPATRAAIIEGLVKNGYAERKGKQILSTEKGINLISVVPDEVKSPVLTADWENKLLKVERGEITDYSFMSEIENFVRQLCNTYSSTDITVSFKSSSVNLGNCPNCGKPVAKGKYGYYCTGKCGMNISKSYGKTLSDNQVVNLLNGKSISYTVKGKKTILNPKAEPFEFTMKDGRKLRGYQWQKK